ncbi:hypothetical protein FH972_025447 [Carpinus fangiana]|uniref:Uncharacterized protein n=1 Tax=Carpinus fangiana TaxID=176857 RepID=A0A5N6L1N7_9ROSI|nr:hypothetical protein FH972_025447 [Carpinus fangiana]
MVFDTYDGNGNRGQSERIAHDSAKAESLPRVPAAGTFHLGGVVCVAVNRHVRSDEYRWAHVDRSKGNAKARGCGAKERAVKECKECDV